MVLINIGVHKLESYKNIQGLYENSYFVHRSYLNYLIFTPNSTEIFYDYFNSKGGVGKQILTGPQQFGNASGKIFNKYGASVLLTNPKKRPHRSSFKLEYYGVDFMDKDITYLSEKPKELHWVILNQRGKKFLITDENLILKDGTWWPNPEMKYSSDKVEEINNILKNDFDYLLPRLHQGEFHLQRTPKDTIEQNIQNFMGQLG